MEHWVHDLNPVAIRLWGNFAIRWYGLAYACAFLIGWFLLSLLYRRGRSPLGPREQESAFFAIVLGVMLGGRLGWVLLYAPELLWRDPLAILAVWQGGMASHGGFVGVALACWWISRRHRISVFRLGDLLSLLTPPGLMLGRLANFVNGELWGKVSQVPWAIVFPASAPPGTPLSQIPPRHPSQLYEAALEGLFLVLYTQLRFWLTGAYRRPGRLAGEFLFLYAAVRVLGEQFREPDAGLILGLSRGSFYSIFLALAGVVLWWRSARRPEQALPGEMPKKS